MKSFAVAATLLTALPMSLSAPSAERIAEIYTEINSGLLEWVQTYTAPNIVWNIPGSGYFNRIYNQSEYLTILAPALGQAIETPITYTVSNSFSDGENGDWSFTEIKGRGGVTVNGTAINIDYAYVAKWEDETIVAINEYLDTLLLQRLGEATGVIPDN